MPDPDSILPQLLLIVCLTLINAFFAAAEMAIVSVKKTRIRMLVEEGNAKAIKLDKLLQEPTRFLSTIQVGITFAGFFSSAAAATGLSHHLSAVLSAQGIPYASEISLVLITLALSFITLVFGELVPKRIALQKAEAIAMFTITPIAAIQFLTLPFIKLLSFSTGLCLRIIGMSQDDLDESVSREEIKSIVEVGQENGVINETEKDMINSIIEFDDITAAEIMTPRTEVYLINIEKPLSDYLDEMLNEKYSRIPVYEEDIDNIIGVLNIKDFLLQARKEGFDTIDIRSLLRPAYFVFEHKNIDILFRELQANKTNMAILIDEYGGFSGIVTMEDLIEEIMGDIADEHDDDEQDIHKLEDGSYLIDGLVTIAELNDELHLEFDEESENFDTVGGLIVQLLGHIPEERDDLVRVQYREYEFEIMKIADKRIQQVRLFKRVESLDNQEAVS